MKIGPVRTADPITLLPMEEHTALSFSLLTRQAVQVSVMGSGGIRAARGAMRYLPEFRMLARDHFRLPGRFMGTL
jgi:hypothetical protein